MGRIILKKRDRIVIPLKGDAMDVIAQRGADVEIFIPLDNRRNGTYKLRIFLRGEGANARVFSAGVLTGEQQLQLTVDTIHEAPNTTGSTLVKAVVKDSARFDFFGMIKILKKAQKSIDFLQQDSLLLSEDASANAVPGLEIEADDVKASHAATVAPVNQDQLFYLRSRGIPETIATQLVAEAFLAPAMKDLTNTLKMRLLEPLQTEAKL